MMCILNFANVAVAWKGFIAKDMRFFNTASAAKHHAVAFQSGSDLSMLTDAR